MSTGNLTGGHSQSCGCLQREKARNRQLLRPYEALFNKLCSVAKRQKRSVDLTYEDFLDFVQIVACHYCGAPVTWATDTYKRHGSGYNLDRKDSSLGYSRLNCVVCCKRCNRGKSDLFTYDEWWAMTEVFRQKSKVAVSSK